MPGDTLVRVEYSTVNYKDGPALTGRSPIIRHWTSIPGSDFVGTVVSSESSAFAPGDRVVLNGFGLGEKHLQGRRHSSRDARYWPSVRCRSSSWPDAVAEADARCSWFKPARPLLSASGALVRENEGLVAHNDAHRPNLRRIVQAPARR